MINVRSVCANYEFYFVSILIRDSIQFPLCWRHICINFIPQPKSRQHFCSHIFSLRNKLCWALSRGKSINQNAVGSTAATTMRQSPLPLHTPHSTHSSCSSCDRLINISGHFISSQQSLFLATECAHTQTLTHILSTKYSGKQIDRQASRLQSHNSAIDSNCLFSVCHDEY